MLDEENAQWGNVSPQTLGGSPVSLCIYVENVDDVFTQALEARANIERDMEVKDHLYDDRAESLIDPFGHKWSIRTHMEDVSFKEMQKRINTIFTVDK